MPVFSGVLRPQGPSGFLRQVMMIPDDSDSAGAARPVSELRAALSSCRSALIGIAVFSGLINLLTLTGSLFMLEVYDRVLPSRSVPTLIGLALITALLFVFQGLIETVRGRMLVRVANQLDWRMSERVYDLVLRLPLETRGSGDGLQPVRDLDTIRSVLSGPGPSALFDLPWLPIYLGICFAFHPAIGWTATAGALVLVVLTILTEVLSRRAVRHAATAGAARNRLAEASRRGAEAVVAMSMAPRLRERWSRYGGNYRAHSKAAGDVAVRLGAAGRAFRMMLQSAVLAVGAYLVIHQEATGGIIIASSILSGRALAPVDMVIGNWKNFISARQSWRRLDGLLGRLRPLPQQLALAPPRRELSVEGLSVTPPGNEKVTLADIGFRLRAGEALGVVGPSASGKSTLARALVGAWRGRRGSIRLDGAALEQWPADTRGDHVGYLPQDVELFEGSIADNIARFRADASMEMVLAAARAADVHDMIVALPQGYNTQIGEQGGLLSAGQKQRVALARALFGDPFLIVLDEPNSNLDAEGEQALVTAIQGAKARGAVVVVIAHRTAALAAVDLVLALAQGRQVAFGPRDDMFQRLMRPAPPAAASLKVVPS
jgi:ATP-binding cassette subfamily C protein